MIKQLTKRDVLKGAGVLGLSAFAVRVAAAPAADSAPAAGLAGTLVFQAGPGGQIYAYNLANGALTPLTHGFDPAISPDGQTVAFVRDGGENLGVAPGQRLDQEIGKASGLGPAGIDDDDLAAALPGRFEGARITLEAHMAEYPATSHDEIRKVLAVGDWWNPDRMIVLTSSTSTIEKHIRLRNRPHEDAETMVRRFQLIDREFRRLAPLYPNTVVINRDEMEFHERADLVAIITAARLPTFPEIPYRRFE